MTCRRPLLALLAGVLLLAGADPAPADGPPAARPDPVRTGQRFLDAFRAGDAATMQAIADDPAVDPHPVADSLLARLSFGRASSPQAPREPLAAAAALAERVRSRPESRGLSLVVARWAELSPDDLARDARLRTALAEANAGEAREAWAEVLRTVEAAGPDLAAPTGLTAISIHAAAGRALRALRRPDEAAAAVRRAAAGAEAMRWPRGQAYQLRSLGVLEAARGRHAASAAAHEEALALREVFGPAVVAAWTRLELANELLKSWRLADALVQVERALPEHEALPDGHRGVARTFALRGDVHLALARVVEARDDYDHAHAIYAAIGDRRDALLVLSRAHQARLRLGDHEAAEAGFLALIEEAEAVPLPTLVAEATLQLGNAVRWRGDPRRAVELHRRAAELATASGHPEVAPYLAAIGADHLLLGEHTEAIDALEAALRAGDTRGVGGMQIGSLHRQLVEAYRKAGRPRDAVRAARDGVAYRRERARDLGESYGGFDQSGGRRVADEGLHAALEWIAAEPASRDEAVEAAFTFAEASRGARLADALAPDRPSGGDGAEREDERRARERLEEARSRVLRLAFGGTSEPEALAAARRDYEAASAARREARSRADLARQGAARPVVEPVSLAAARAALPQDALLVLYHVTRARILAVTVSRDGADLLDLGDAEPVARAATAWLEAVATPGADEGRAPETLYEALLRPLEPRLAEGTTLLVGRDGPLSFLPFEALVRAQGAHRRRAVESWAFAYVPSATVYATLAARAATGRDRLVALGDPVHPGEAGRPAAEADRARDRGLTALDRLPATAEEVRDVAGLFPEARRTVLLREHATRARLVAALESASDRLRVLHLACHGFADLAQPGRSGLVLSEADVLAVDDVAAMRVPADLVVLSACESGQGPTQRGEGILGLPRAFLAAGATRVVAADRRIADADARALLRAFYEAHLRDGLEPAAALRAAKLSRLREGGAAAHPYAWAGLVLWE